MVYKGHLSRNMKDTQIRKLLVYYFSGIREETHNLGSVLKPYWRKIVHAFSKN
jgi:hypothetical protein